MWCPEGFLSLYEIWRVLEGEAEKWCEENPHADDDQPYVHEDGWHIEKATVRQKALRFWLMQMFLDNQGDNFYVAQPNGTALKVSSAVTHRAYMLMWPFPDNRDHWELFASYEYDEYIIFDPELFSLRLDGAYDHLEEKRRLARLKLLAPLDGLPLCWKLPAGPVDWLSICTMEAFRTLEEAEAFLAASESPAQELSPVVRILDFKQRNPTATRVDVKAALFGNMSYNRFRMFWSQASERNPKLSKPGKKPRMKS